MIKSKKSLALLALIVSIVIIGIIIWNIRKNNPATRQIRQIGITLQQQGIESQSDYVKFRQIRDKINRAGVISDRDLDWLLALMRKRSTHPEDVNNDVMALLNNLNNVTPAQRQRIFNAVIPFLTNPVATDTYHFLPIGAANVLGHFKDQRAIPYLVPLLKNSDPTVRERVRHALNKLGYTANMGTTD